MSEHLIIEQTITPVQHSAYRVDFGLDDNSGHGLDRHTELQAVS